MRHVVFPTMVAFGLIGVSVGLGSAVASAAPAPSPSATGGQAAKGKKVCTITDERLVELSGMVATETGYIVINDGSDDAEREKIFFLNKKCKVDEVVSYSGGGPLDTEDMVLSPDGTTLWIADIGDNPTSKERRQTVALWSMPADGSKQPVIHRLAYPDGPHDAEALLLTGDGTPIIVTKVAGTAALYAPTGPLQPEAREGVPMKKVGELTLPKTDTPHPLPAARMMVTGAAIAPGGGRVVLRTYTDAFEWDVTDGDVVAALTGKQLPRVTALPDEPLGEAITYTPDGKQFLTVSETADLEDVEPTILAYTPATKVAAPVSAKKDAGNEKSLFDRVLDKLGLQGLTYLVAGVGLIGAVLVGFGVAGIIRARRQPVRSAGGQGDGKGGTAVEERQPALATARVYGGPGVPEHRAYDSPERPASAKRPTGAVYGAGAAAGSVYGSQAGTDYGGPSPRGSVYGRGAVYGGGGYRENPDAPGGGYRSRYDDRGWGGDAGPGGYADDYGNYR